MFQTDGKLKMANNYAIRRKLKKKKTFTPMDPRPASDSIVALIRNYSELKKDSQYSFLGHLEDEYDQTVILDEVIQQLMILNFP